MNHFCQQKGLRVVEESECSEGMNLSPFRVENLEEELIQDILETLESIENYPTASSEARGPESLASDPPLQVATTDGSPGFSTGLFYFF